MARESCLLAIILPTEDGKKPYIKNVSNSLDALQAEVGGYIEVVSIATDMIAVVNEEGRLLGLPDNRYISGLVGNAVILSSKISGDGEFTGLPATKIADVLRMFGG